MEKEFVPYEIALALKELGFNEKCGACYYKKFDNEIGYHKVYRDFNFVSLTVSAPTFSQAFRFFREKYNIIPNIHSVYIDETHTKINFWVWFANYEENSNEEIYYGTYEEAELECLKKLIEIIKNK